MIQWLKKTLGFSDSDNGILGLDFLFNQHRRRMHRNFYNSPQVALSLGAFHRAVDLISSTVARCDCKVYRDRAENTCEPYTAHPAYHLLYRQPNELTTPQEFFRTLIADVFLYGNGLAFIEEVDGEPKALWNLDGSQVQIAVLYRESFYKPEIRYGVMNALGVAGQTTAWLRPDQVIAVKGLGTNPYCGMNLLEAAKDTFQMATSALSYGIYYLENSGNLRTVVELPAFKSPEQKQEFMGQFSEDHDGEHNAFRPLYVPVGTKVSQLTINAEEAALIGVQARLDTTLANLCGLPPIKVGVQSAASYGSVQEENLALKSDCYDKWLSLLEAQLTMKLCTEAEKRKGNVHCLFDRRTLDTADIDKFQAREIALFESNLKTREEVRTDLGLPANAPEGDRYLIEIGANNVPQA